MSISLLDQLILGGFFALNMFIGLYYGRKIKGIREYAVGRQNYSEFVILATVFSTVIGGGSTFGVIEKVYLSGFCYAFVFCGMALNRIWIGSLISRNLKAFQHCTTVSEIMETHYGVFARKMTSLFGILTTLGGFSAQTYAIGFMMNQVTGISHAWGIIIGCGIFIIYSTMGGMRSIIAADVLQFCFTFALIPILAMMGTDSFHQSGQNVFEQALEAISWNHINLGMIAVFLTLLLASGDPAFLQRIFLSKNVRVMSRSLKMTGILSIFFYITMGILGIMAQNVMPGLETSPIIPIIHKYIPYGFKGLLLCSFLAVIWSTADAGLNMIGISCGNDFKKDFSDKKKLLIARISTVVVGGFAMIIATKFNSILEIIVFGFTFWGPSVFVPLMGSLAGYFVSRRQMYAGVILGMVSTVLWNHFLKKYFQGFEGAIIGMLLHSIYFYIHARKQKTYRSL